MDRIERVASILADATQPMLPHSWYVLQRCSPTHGLYFAMFRLGVWQELKQDSYCFWMLVDFAEIADELMLSPLDNHPSL